MPGKRQSAGWIERTPCSNSQVLEWVQSNRRTAMASTKFREPVEKILDRYKKVFDTEVRFAEEFSRFSLVIPGLRCEDYTRAGIPAVWRIGRLWEITRLLPLKYKGTCLGAFNTIPGLTGVGMSARIKFHPAIYTLAKLNSPMVLEGGFGVYSSKSYTVLYNVSDLQSRVSFIQFELQVGFIDHKTGMPTLIPDEIQTVLTKHAKPGRVQVNCPEDGDVLHTYMARVSASDCDMSYHCTAANYVKYCMDAATEAQLEGKLKGFDHDILSCPVSELNIRFRMQCFPGNELIVESWQDNEKINHKIKQKKGGKLVAYCSVKFDLSPSVDDIQKMHIRNSTKL